MDSWERQGAAVADVAFEILSGKPHSTISRHAAPLNSYQVDERQLKRWELSSSQLPAGSEIHFQQFNLWQQYRWQILGICALLLLQGAVIAGLAVERRRRRAAELELRQRLLELLHLNRTAVAGTLSGSIAHELNQPLAAIQSNVDAARLYLTQTPPNIAKVESILTSIALDDQRAAGIIARVRGMLRKKDEVELQEFDLRDVINETMETVRPEAMKNGVDINVCQPSGALLIRADRIQLQQVLVNLAMNGIDAMCNCGPSERRMSIGTALVDAASVEVSVADTGTGIPPEKLNRVFDEFYTTKGHGTGLGLSITRTIVETFGGKIWAENCAGAGAVFRFTLPLLKTAQVHCLSPPMARQGFAKKGNSSCGQSSNM
jgi:C4-dicarboxylate-specific signal transduction histidine kinase